MFIQDDSQKNLEKSKLSKVLLAILLIIPTGIFVYILTALLLIGAFGFEVAFESIFDYLILITILGSAISFSLLPTFYQLSKIYQNRTIFLAVLFVFIIFSIGIFASFYGRDFKNKQALSTEISKAKLSFQVYKPTYLPPDAMEFKKETGETGRGNYIGILYFLGESPFNIRQTSDPNNFYLSNYRCAAGIDLKFVST